MHKSLFPILFILIAVAIWFKQDTSNIEPIPRLNTEEAPLLDDSTLSYLKEFELKLSNGMKQRGIPGGAVVIVKGSDVIYQKGLGVKVNGTSDSVDVNTVFRLGSV